MAQSLDSAVESHVVQRMGVLGSFRRRNRDFFDGGKIGIGRFPREFYTISRLFRVVEIGLLFGVGSIYGPFFVRMSVSFRRRNAVFPLFLSTFPPFGFPPFLHFPVLSHPDRFIGWSFSLPFLNKRSKFPANCRRFPPSQLHTLFPPNTRFVGEFR